MGSGRRWAGVVGRTGPLLIDVALLSNPNEVELLSRIRVERT